MTTRRAWIITLVILAVALASGAGAGCSSGLAVSAGAGFAAYLLAMPETKPGRGRSQAIPDPLRQPA